MNLINKYKLHKLENKDKKKLVKIVLNSNFDYENHDLNILKECLNIWSTDETNKFSPITFSWIFVDPDKKEKMYFISTNVNELKKLKLEKLAENEDILSNSYMDSCFTKAIFSSYYTLLNAV